MSTSTPTTAASTLRNFFLAFPKGVVLGWLVIVGIGSVIMYWNKQNTSALRSDLEFTKTQSNVFAEEVRRSNTGIQSDISQMRGTFQSANEQISQLQQVIESQQKRLDQVSAASSHTQSQLAVERVRVAKAKSEIESSRETLLQVTALLQQWEAQQTQLKSGDLGRRVNASPAHATLAETLLTETLPTRQQLTEWEAVLLELANGVDATDDDPGTVRSLSTEYVQQLKDLGRSLTAARSQLERTLSTVKMLSLETARQTPTTETLEQTLARRKAEQEQSNAARIALITEQARQAAEQVQGERIAALVKQGIEAETRERELTEEAKLKKTAELARLERERLAEETQVAAAKVRAETAKLQGEKLQLDAATERANLEREFEQDLPTIRSVLTAFISPGFQNGGPGEGPMSFAYIQANGALDQTEDGRQNLAHIVGNSGRPSGPLRRFRGGMTRDQEAMCAKAQQLLTKYGPMMVEKGLLAQ